MHIIIDEKNDPIPDKFKSSNISALLLCSPGTWLPWREDAPERRWGFHKRCKYLNKAHADAFTFLDSTHCLGIVLHDQCRGWPVVQKLHSEHYKRTNSGGGDQTTSSTHQRTCRNYYNLCGPNYTNAMKMSKKDKNQSPQRCFANSGRPNLEFERFEGFCFGLRNTYWRILLIVFLYQKYSFLNKQLLIINKSSSQCGLSL